MTMDVIMTFCFGKPIDAVDAKDFKAPILEAMDASLPVFVRFKYSDLYKNMILKCPPKLSKIISPSTAGLVDLQQVCMPHSLYQIKQSYRNLELICSCIDASPPNHLLNQRPLQPKTPPPQHDHLPPPPRPRSPSQ